MSAEPEQLRPPQLLAQVESRIGLDFFADPTLESYAHESPARLPEDQAEPRITLYTAGLRVIAEERRAARQGNADDPALAREVRNHISDIRGELMLLDPDLQTAAVRGLRRALQDVRAPVIQGASHRPKKSDVLPPGAMPIGAVDTMLNLGHGSAYIAMRHHKVEPAARLNLPGPARAEVCVDWQFIRKLADRHGLRNPEDIVEWDRLPQSPEDTDPERIAYAREVQLRYVDPYKLSNIEGLTPEQAPPPKTLPTARPHHIATGTLSRLMGGGVHFVDGYCIANSVPLRPMRRHNHFGSAQYLSLEDAATVWAAYEESPPAGPDETTVIQVAHDAGIVEREVVYRNMRPDELAQIQIKRAKKPAGRAIDHVPTELADRLVGRLSAINLPPHLMPVAFINQIIKRSYSAIARRNDMPQHPPIQLRLTGQRQVQVCMDWQTIRHLAGPKNETRIDIDWSRLPRGPHDDDPERIAYARSIQAALVPPKMLDARQARRPEVPVFDGHERRALPQAEIATVPYRSYMQPLQEILQAIPAAQRPTAAQAILFIRQHGENVINTDRGTCVFGVSAGLINHNFNADAYPPQQRNSNWLNRDQIARLTGQPVEQVGADLAALDWSEVRPSLHGMPININDRTNAGAVTRAHTHLIWCNTGNGLVLPHYNPAIVERLQGIAGERAAAASGEATPPAPAPR